MGDQPDTMRWAPVLRWCLATRRQLDRWEELLAQMMLISVRNEKPPGALVWEVRMEHHFALVAADNLRRALNRVQQTGFLKDLHQDIELLRHLHEHWDAQEDVFANAANPGPVLNKTAAAFHERHPGRSPYGFFNFKGKTGPQLGPAVNAWELRSALDRIEERAIEVSPDLAPFLTPRPPSPWVCDDYDNWWPNPAGPTPNPATPEAPLP
jgi:hypothetical protein